MVRDSIKPDVTMFVRYDTKVVEGKQIVAVEIQRGTERPYYLAKKGLRPEGVYVRQGTSSVPATTTAIRRMIKDTDGDSFEAMRSLEQNLTFQAAAKEFEVRNIGIWGAPDANAWTSQHRWYLYQFRTALIRAMYPYRESGCV